MMSVVVICLVALLLRPSLSSATECDNIRSTCTDASTRTEQALQGLFHYYWRSDPTKDHENIKFFFACAQLGGNGGLGNLYQCSCGNPDSCVNCYRWYDAITLESLATYGIYANTTNNSEVADIMFAHSPYNAKWDASAACIWIDDFSWYGLAYLRTYEWLKDPKWLLRSLELFDWVWDNGWDKDCGGFWWSNCGWVMFKDSITNMEALHFSSKLAYMFPEETDYLDRAVKLWNWLFAFDGGYGLMSDKFLVSTGAVPEQCCNATSAGSRTKCYNTRVSGTSYNQGILISSAAYLYLRTKDKTYLDIGLRAIDAILTNYTAKDGVLVDEPRSYQSYQGGECIAGQDPGGDWYSFNGIFMLHLSYFIDLLHKDENMPKATLAGIASLINATSDAAWNRSALWPPFNKSYDICNNDITKFGPNITFPKFHWWWGENVTKQITAPDPRLFLHELGIRCYSLTNNSQIWEGQVKSELECTNKCRDNPLCSKYLFNVDQEFSGLNCWNWGYNRSDHNCSLSKYGWNIGVKRPIGDVTCAGKCGSKEPQKLDQGVCYCDSDCAEHLDCCMDYANHCLASKTPSCKGQCGVVNPQPLAGGGYCYCDDICNPWMTDNNSDGSCCIDYPTECSKIPMPPCLDARSQGSAFNLFVAHLKLTQIMN